MSSLNPKVPADGYWRSLRELADSDEYRRFAAAEFPEADGPHDDAVSRRRFLQLMGASLALAGVVGCRWPQEEIVPFSESPQGTVPGVSRRYATVMEIAGVVLPLLVTSYDGRPIKVEGNPEHPLSRGATDHFAQASLLELYDPGRSRDHVRRDDGRASTAGRSVFLAEATGYFTALRESGGRGLAILSESTASPTTAAARAELLRVCPDARWFEYEPVSRDNEREGARTAFGNPCSARIDLESAAVILALDSDLLRDHPTALRNVRDFSDARRDPARGMNRLYVCESDFTLTGGVADHRFPTSTAAIPHIALMLTAELVVGRGLDLPPALAALRPVLTAVHAAGHQLAWLEPVARDLAAAKGASLVHVGPRQPVAVQAVVNVCNAVLGNVGKTVSYVPDPDPQRPSHVAAIAELAAAIAAGEVETLVILGGNPAHDAPADLDLPGLLESVQRTIRLGLYEDETSQLCRWHLPRAHHLESWSDVLDADGRYAVAQPLIQPLHGGWTTAGLLALMAGGEQRQAHEMVRDTARARLGAVGFEKAWRKLLHKGCSDKATATVLPGWSPSTLRTALESIAASHVPEPGPHDIRIDFVPDPSLYDGRFANNAWLQELPDFMTKLTWGNAALIGPATADALRIEDGDVLRLELKGRSVEVPAYVLPGHAPWAVTLGLGHGRSGAGLIGDGVGCRTYAMRTLENFDGGSGLAVVRTGERVEPASTQDHFAIDKVGRAERERRVATLLISGDLEEYRRDPTFAQHRQHHPPLESLWKERDHDGHKWGMVIDLNVCTGCNACVTACQAENNVPIVGREQVLNGREMHWLRTDRYFQGDPENPRAMHQPVACVHCELAPCEQVCPVGATMHSAEGLNVMAYNRCVGTRYCSNNCPYKVRRFNFFNYNQEKDPIALMARNPEVTVRARGVMEKCTYCVQRIEAARITAKNEGRPLADGEIVPACQQTCPTGAITFGDLNDPDSEAARLRENGRAYHMLAELNIKPRTAYLARLRNTNPELAESVDESRNAAH